MKYDYFYYLDLYTKEECQILNELIQEQLDPSVIDIKAEGVSKTSTVGSFALGKLKTELEKFNQTIISINRNNFGFDVFETCDLEFLNYNTYSSENNGQYDWHSDKVLNECYDIKLTAILNIGTDEYEGGNFEMFLNTPTVIEEISTPGSMLVFPSFLYHRVTPVTKGKRKTISRWVNGPTIK